VRRVMRDSICGHTLREEDTFGSDGGGLPSGRFCPADDWDELVVQPDPIPHDDGFYSMMFWRWRTGFSRMNRRNGNE
jgi:hypothetical protein